MTKNKKPDGFIPGREAFIKAGYGKEVHFKWRGENYMDGIQKLFHKVEGFDSTVFQQYLLFRRDMKKLIRGEEWQELNKEQE